MYTSITGESHCGIETEYMLKVQFQTAFESLRAVVLLSGELQTDKPLTLKLASCFYELPVEIFLILFSSRDIVYTVCIVSLQPLVVIF